MDATHVLELASKFSEDISALKDALEPFTRTNLNETANKLPVLDRAKFFTLAAYSIESILFWVDAKSHPVFTELARVRQYYEKIRVAETGEQRPRLRLDKDAAGRIIKHELASNNKNQGTKRKFDERGVSIIVKNENPNPSQAVESEKPKVEEAAKIEVEAEAEVEVKTPAKPIAKPDEVPAEDIVMLSDAEEKSSKKKKTKDKKDKKSKKKKDKKQKSETSED